MPRLVLVADGSPSHQRRAQGILTGEGLEVVTVSNGVAAIKKLPGSGVVLVLADVSMPGRDGYEVCEFVKNSPELSKVPVLLSYSEQTPYDEGKAQQVRADGRILKPFGQDELLNVVSRFLPPEAAAPPPPPPPPPPIEVPEESMGASEAADMPMEEPPPQESLPDLSALSGEGAFGTESDDAPELNPPPVSFEEALAQASGETATEQTAVMPFGGFPGSEPPPAEEAAPTHLEPTFEEESSTPSAEEEEEPVARTMMFRMPVQIAEPVLADDSTATPPQQEEPPQAAEPPAEKSVEAATPPPAEEAASEAPAMAPPEEPAAPAPIEEASEPEAPAAAPPAEEQPVAAADEGATGSAAVLDTELVHWIVHNVVVRMAPPALSTAQVEELIRQITDEMINDLTQPPPEA